MLRSVNSIHGYKLQATDGEIGKSKDFLFDDRDWAIRFMVADTGGWLSGRKVLITPAVLHEPEWDKERFPVDLSKEKIQNSPSIDEHAPVSRSHEKDLFRYYGLGFYWMGPGLWGTGMAPHGAHPTQVPETSATEDVQREEHLRSVNEIKGYHVQALDKSVGKVSDFIVDEETWALKWLVVDTGKWLTSREFLVSPDWVTDINWGEKQLSVDLTSEQIMNSPEYDSDEPVTRVYEDQLYEYYGRQPRIHH